MMSSHKVVDDSFKSVMSVTVPILLTTLSANLMYVTDRAILAGYSLVSMNAAMLSGTFLAIFTLFFIGLANTAEIYVGQYNGAKQYDKIANATWQMIYLSLLSILVFAPLAYFTEELNTFPQYLFDEGVAYQKPLLYFGFLPVLISAISTFFIGQGKSKIVTFIIVSGSILNVGLDFLFIYKFDMGCKGAAFATVASEFCQFIVLASVFFNKKNRTEYNTIRNHYFDISLFKNCIKIGMPTAFGNCIILIAWFLTQSAFAHTSENLSTVYSICISVYIIFIFIGDGLNKAIATISSNMIGQKNLTGIRKTYKRFILIAIAFGLLTAIPLIVFSEWFLNILDALHSDIHLLHSQIKTSLFWVSFSIIMEAIVYITWGVLLSGGDSKYPTIANQICTWGFVVAPTWILYYFNLLCSTAITFVFLLLANTLLVILLYRRYKSLKWYNRLIDGS